jgi:hypothetical protein
MKHHLLAAAAAVCLSACAGTKVTNTVIATGAASPKAIYIRPFNISDGAYKGSFGGDAVKAIRQSQGPALLSRAMKEELEKIAPATVLADDETADRGWIVEGDIEVVNAGYPLGRAVAGNLGLGRSGILLHVRVTEAGSTNRSDEKGGNGPVVYEFDVAGGSRLAGKLGSIRSSGYGNAVAFDMRNAAEKIREMLEVDGHRYGMRESALR